MIETVVIATDGSASAERAVRAGADLAERFGAAVHALYVVDRGEVAASPTDVREDFERALTTEGGRALSDAIELADGDLTTAVREGDPASEIVAYAREQDADVIATGTRGRHGEHRFLLGSVADAVVRRAEMPVLTVRQLSPDDVPV
ncbi:MAG: universal stress protein [Haloarculaceae archaeon]